MPDYSFVDHPDSIHQNISGYAQLGVDTEFMREKTYFAQLCLVQISTSDAIYCVDPLVENGQRKFWEQLLACSWVVHSARQDIEVIYQTAGAMPREVFDTQIAAGLLGMPAQVGYAGLVKDLFDVEMAKSHTRADWTRRPLAEAVLDYAAEDVEYLLPAADILSEGLDKKGRLDWARQDSALLLDPLLYDISGSQAVDRLKGAIGRGSGSFETTYCSISLTNCHRPRSSWPRSKGYHPNWSVVPANTSSKPWARQRMTRTTISRPFHRTKRKKPC